MEGRVGAFVGHLMADGAEIIMVVIVVVENFVVFVDADAGATGHESPPVVVATVVARAKGHLGCHGAVRIAPLSGYAAMNCAAASGRGAVTSGGRRNEELKAVAQKRKRKREEEVGDDEKDGEDGEEKSNQPRPQILLEREECAWPQSAWG